MDFAPVLKIYGTSAEQIGPGDLVYDADDEMYVVLTGGGLLPVRRQNGNIVKALELDGGSASSVYRGVSSPIRKAAVRVVCDPQRILVL